MKTIILAGMCLIASIALQGQCTVVLERIQHYIEGQSSFLQKIMIKKIERGNFELYYYVSGKWALSKVRGMRCSDCYYVETESWAGPRKYFFSRTGENIRLGIECRGWCKKEWERENRKKLPFFKKTNLHKGW